MKQFWQHFIEGLHALTLGKFRRVKRLPEHIFDEDFWERAMPIQEECAGKRKES